MTPVDPSGPLPAREPANGPEPPDLDRILEQARDLGFFGPAPSRVQREHAERFADVIERERDRPPASFADLGPGGGVPGLVLAVRWSAAHAVLVESNRRRAAFLRDASTTLDLGDRCIVMEERAEVVAHDPMCREQFDVVTARSFAEPAVTAEIAAGLVRPRGLLVVSEPPEWDPDRWPSTGLDALGLGPALRAQTGTAHFVVIEKITAAPLGVPRAVGRPSKRPMW